MCPHSPLCLCWLMCLHSLMCPYLARFLHLVMSHTYSLCHVTTITCVPTLHYVNEHEVIEHTVSGGYISEWVWKRKWNWIDDGWVAKCESLQKSAQLYILSLLRLTNSVQPLKKNFCPEASPISQGQVAQWFSVLAAMAMLSARTWVRVPPTTSRFFRL